MTWSRFEGAPDDWDNITKELNGGFYQSFGWGEMRRVNGWTPLRLTRSIAGNYVAAASVLFKYKFGIAVCWVPGGVAGSVFQFGHQFHKILIDALGTRFVYCRISFFNKDNKDTLDFLKIQKWIKPRAYLSSGLSMCHALGAGESSRLERLSSNWRHNLKRSKRYGLQVEHWVSPNPDEMLVVYREMETLKSLSPQHTKIELKSLFDIFKNNVVVYSCRDEGGQLLAFRAAGIYGSTALDLLAASGKAARKVYASHATLWALLLHCESCGIHRYDLSGVDPENNKGVYNFKKGTGASLKSSIGEREWASIPGLLLLANALIARKFS